MTGPVKPVAKETPKKVTMVRAVFGVMVDPFTGVKYHQLSVELAGEIKKGSWLDCQIQAGKLELC